MNKFSLAFNVVLLTFAIRTFADSPAILKPGNEAAPGLRDTVVLVIRHAEKPEDGSGLSPAGEKRAAAYSHYFKHFTVDSQPLKPDYIFATADSAKSSRPRLTVEPLAKELALKIDNRFKNKDFGELAQEVRSNNHGKCVLIAWHHEKIPELVQALGGDSAALLPGGKWPEKVFNWVIELRYDHDGRIIPAATKRINEKLLPGDAD